MSKANWMATGGLALGLALLAWGCAGTSNDQAVHFSQAKGEHPATWTQDHYASYIKAPEQCATCHGSTTSPDLAGGISKVSCWACHTNPSGPNHPAGWADPTQHGRQGAMLAPVAQVPGQPPVMAGFAHCTKCHGADYENGLTVSCKSCHTTAPHPKKPWASQTPGQPSHIYTDQANAGACAQCHTAGANSDMKPLTTPPAGTQPGCFNETLCHGTDTTRPVPMIQGGAKS